MHPGLVDLALQAVIAGAALGALRDLRRHVFIRHEGDGAKRGGAFVFWVLARFMRSRVFGLHAFAALLRFRPVRPVPPAWHEMPGHACAERRRPARAVFSKVPPCDGWYARGVAWRGDWSVWVCREVRVGGRGVRGVRGVVGANAGPGT